MKICTITYDGDTPQGLPYRALSPEACRAFTGDCVDAITETIEALAMRHDISPETLIWNPQIGVNPVFVRVACEDALANALRFELPDELLIEFDPAECDKVCHRICKP